MSEWYAVDSNGSDIEIDVPASSVNFFVCANDQGSVYLSLSFAQIKQIASTIEASKPTKAHSCDLPGCAVCDPCHGL